ncbi:hypothetical protein GCM10022224_071590 [Nonomuraea antimicrobica]|uniref:Secreted protein n=1 Tax=Nonomuraea antimicrobica TaxID=561173 RepID=A0ABP7CSW2_9ACTN
MRIPTTTVALAAAGVMAMAPLAPAQAARGLLIIDDRHYENPSGCHPLSSNDGSRFVHNLTGQSAYFFSQEDCQGLPVDQVHPAETGRVDHVRSFHIARHQAPPGGNAENR